MAYDNNNIFAKILREEIPCKKVYENEYALAFHDINPQAKLHILRGQKYIFDGSAVTSHPIRLSSDSGNSSPYTTGYTIGSDNTHVFIPASNAPSTLYYYCSSHSGMGGSIQVIELKTDIVLEYTNGADNVDVLDTANAENFDESLSAKSISIIIPKKSNP